MSDAAESTKPSPAKRARPAAADRASWDLSVSQLLGPHGPLRANVEGFSPREQQIAMAKGVEQALKRGRPCLAEAGTGVGKTFGYLVPLAKWLQENDEAIAVVSTHTIALQSQLVERDIPTLLRALPEWDVRPAVLKGRANFLCLQDMEAARSDILLENEPKFKDVLRWANDTETGDVGDLPFTAPFWSEICANGDTCRGRECRFYDRCFYYKARKNAEDCNLLVVNHALFFADLRLRLANTGGPTLLPNYEAVVFDEAHHVEDMATRAFGLEWGSRRVPNLLGRVRRLGAERVAPQTLDAIEVLHNQVTGAFLHANNSEAFVDELLRTDADRETFTAIRGELCGALDKLAKEMADLAENSNDSGERDRCAGLARISARISTELFQVSKWDDAPDNETTKYFRWYQTRRLRGNQAMTTLTRTPLAIDGTMQNALLKQTPRVICTSATLASGGSFSYLKKRLGMAGDANVPAPVEVIEGSPFDYEKNCLLYVPRRLADGLQIPTFGGYNDGFETGLADRLAVEILALVEAAQGRTFALFTSHKMLRDVHERLCDLCTFPILVQGDMPNGRLVDEFKTLGNALLLGTASFWEGVDVRGDRLSCVIMDKLPFAIPSAPMQRAREEDCRAQGGDPFNDLSIPQAQLRLKQGFGRLLRSTTDRGVVAILDERIWTKRYGKSFLQDLPPCPVTDTRTAAVQFLQSTPPPSPAERYAEEPNR